MHQYECKGPNADISLQSGRFWAMLIASIRERLLDFRCCWIVFICIVRECPGGLLQFSNKLLFFFRHQFCLAFRNEAEQRERHRAWTIAISRKVWLLVHLSWWLPSTQSHTGRWVECKYNTASIIQRQLGRNGDSWLPAIVKHKNTEYIIEQRALSINSLQLHTLQEKAIWRLFMRYILHAQSASVSWNKKCTSVKHLRWLSMLEAIQQRSMAWMTEILSSAGRQHCLICSKIQ